MFELGQLGLQRVPFCFRGLQALLRQFRLNKFCLQGFLAVLQPEPMPRTNHRGQQCQTKADCVSGRIDIGFGGGLTNGTRGDRVESSIAQAVNHARSVASSSRA